jgi:hypothetical protein
MNKLCKPVFPDWFSVFNYAIQKKFKDYRV